MRFARASLVSLTLAGVLLASLPIDARTASRTRGGGGHAASRPSHGSQGARSATPRSVSGGGATRSRPGGGGGSAPHHAQGKATWGYGHGGHHGHGHGYYHGGWYGYPYYGYGYGWPYWGWGVSVGWGYPYYPYGGYYPYAGGPVYGGEYVGNAWIETDVTPKRASVRLDGEDVGFAKDWNGVWDRLPIEPGEHVVEFALEGYQTLQFRLDARSGGVYRLSRELQKGQGTDPRSATEAPPQRAAPSAGGYLRLSIEPADAAVYLDGVFVGRASELGRRQAGRPLAAGEHELEVVRPGFLPDRRTIVVEPDGVGEVRIELEPELPEGGGASGVRLSSRGF